MTKAKIDRSLSKLKQGMVKMIDTLTLQYEHAKSLIRQPIPLLDKELKIIKRFYQNIQQEQYVFFESSIWKLMQQRMMSQDLRRVLVNLNIVQNLVQINEFGYHFSMFLANAQVPKIWQKIIDKKILLLLKLFSDVKNFIVVNKSKLAQPIIDQVKQFITHNREEIQKLLQESLSDNPQNEWFMRKIYSQLHYLNRSADNVERIVAWFYYLKKHQTLK